MKPLSRLEDDHAEYHRRSHDPFCPTGCEWPGTGAPEKQQQPTMADFLAVASAIDEAREMLRAFVAGMVADGFTDGFTDEQARAIAAGFFASTINRKDTP